MASLTGIWSWRCRRICRSTQLFNWPRRPPDEEFLPDQPADRIVARPTGNALAAVAPVASFENACPRAATGRGGGVSNET